MLNLQQTKLLLLQTGQKLQYQQDKSTVFFAVPFSKGSSMFHNGTVISLGTVNGYFDASFA